MRVRTQTQCTPAPAVTTTMVSCLSVCCFMNPHRGSEVGTITTSSHWGNWGKRGEESAQHQKVAVRVSLMLCCFNFSPLWFLKRGKIVFCRLDQEILYWWKSIRREGTTSELTSTCLKREDNTEWEVDQQPLYLVCSLKYWRQTSLETQRWKKKNFLPKVKKDRREFISKMV